MGPLQRRRTLPLRAGDRNGFAHGARRSWLPVVDRATFADYGTAIGTLVLAIATFVATRSQPAGDDAWLATIGRHWNLDHPDPR